MARRRWATTTALAVDANKQPALLARRVGDGAGLSTWGWITALPPAGKRKVHASVSFSVMAGTASPWAGFNIL
eukprot:CAMPEP_0178395854 /NCGR_PEP_ID=MMETSP0689_2-20121128/13431_1 /TAXON_ID=160604 /ORGANISM="Amphidinium massartii, Strain CS-259" /LENGTH=72 /DNA_ID=CAMNT_0020016517 /DNA_START=115 /DNA_END=333 /DNA_ORIENTATION=-